MAHNALHRAGFRPPWYLRNRHVQTLLNSSPVRRASIQRRTAAFRDSSQQWLLDGGDGVRLLAYLNQASEDRGLVVLLHGWEGSSDSNYLLSSAATLYDQGYSVLRLNLRDHGPSHHLNTGLFHSCRLDEVVNSVADIGRKLAVQPLFLVGFSLGGNFALRVARAAPGAGIPLQRVVAICPALSPHAVLHSLETGPPVYNRYFIKKWRRSLRLKQECFPELYDFQDWFKLEGLHAQTAYLVDRYTDYPNIDEYLYGYSVAEHRLQELTVPADILAAEDDPVIPLADFLGLHQNPALRLTIAEHGGHCGFIQNWRLRSWVESYISACLEGGAAETGDFSQSG